MDLNLIIVEFILVQPESHFPELHFISPEINYWLFGLIIATQIVKHSARLELKIIAMVPVLDFTPQFDLLKGWVQIMFDMLMK